MDTARLKRFATEARNILLTGVIQRLSTLGFDIETGTASEEPQKFEGGAVFMGDTVSEEFYNQWTSLNNNIQEREVKNVVEEAAYTWFNRLIAIRILSKQGFIEPVLQYDSERTPVIVTEARQGRVPSMDDDTRRRFEDVVDDDSMTNEQFAILIVAFCHSNSIISKCFGSISDYTELLLPSNILSSGGFVDMLNDSELITDEDYHSAELIGWLYQFYISEKKDEVFSKKGKVEADEIPAATQIFTPNWIVKYMVQNTVGRIYLDNNPYATELKEKWEYLVEGEPTPEDKIYKFDDLTELKIGDLACGSGHILVECFDLLFDLYIYEGYSRKDAVENIFKYNLTGIDIDKRAKQLATFALILKACQKDRIFTDALTVPNILTMPHCDRYTWRDLNGHFCCHYGITGPNHIENIDEAFQLLEQANNLGSIMKFHISEKERDFMQNSVEIYESNKLDSFEELINGIKIILSLTEKYSALIMNPPYMGAGNMNSNLSNFVKKYYESGKSDLFAAFMILAKDRLAERGKYGMINMHSWMFLSSFEKLRDKILSDFEIESMLHLGPRTFDELSGEVVQNCSFVISKCKPYKGGTYYRLIYNKCCEAKRKAFLEQNSIFRNIHQSKFKTIPGEPIAYWVEEKYINAFENDKLNKICKPSKGMMPGSNHILFNWEVSRKGITFHTTSHLDSLNSDSKWYPYFKGGAFRRWSGNQEYIVDYLHDGENVKAGDRNPNMYFKNNINWSKISSGHFSARIGVLGGLYDDAACQCEVYNYKNDFKYILAYLNSNVAQEFLWIISQTFNYISGDISKLPLIQVKDQEIEKLVDDNIQLTQEDWDNHERSWNFCTNPLIKILKISHKNVIREIYKTLTDIWTKNIDQLCTNEIKLNEKFTNLYKLTNEIKNKIDLTEVSVLQEGEIRIKGNEIEFQPDVIIKQLISYAVGCMMGRYSTDKEGLILANQGDGLKEFDELVPDAKYRPDDDGIIPLMDADSSISDNASTRFKKWLSVTFGEDSLIENLNFVEKCLGKSIDSYFEKDFWKDHKKMYQNRPIYWLFSSKKGAFQCLAYMHRMNPYTAERVRTQYLLPHIECLMKRQQELMEESAVLSTMERKELDNITKQIDECREYHERLHIIADEQISFDLDDGVVVNYAKFGDVLAKLK